MTLKDRDKCGQLVRLHILLLKTLISDSTEESESCNTGPNLRRPARELTCHPAFERKNPKPRTRPNRHLCASQPAALPRCERRGITLSRPRGLHVRPTQPHHGGAPRPAARFMAPP